MRSTFGAAGRACRDAAIITAADKINIFLLISSKKQTGFRSTLQAERKPRSILFLYVSIDLDDKVGCKAPEFRGIGDLHRLEAVGAVYNLI